MLIRITDTRDPATTCDDQRVKVVEISAAGDQTPVTELPLGDSIELSLPNDGRTYAITAIDIDPSNDPPPKD